MSKYIQGGREPNKGRVPNVGDVQPPPDIHEKLKTKESSLFPTTLVLTSTISAAIKS
jgi:hypothetical protein